MDTSQRLDGGLAPLLSWAYHHKKVGVGVGVGVEGAMGKVYST